MQAIPVTPSRSQPARQIVLPWRKSVAMALTSLHIRFFRSLVTAGSLALAIAFFSYTQLNTTFARELLHLHGELAHPLLLKQGYVLNDTQTDILSSAREIWLLVLSLLVCTVGIINAQLMSVTERFREIGIMKCLGALDRIILRLFLLEALMLGILGSAVGALLGAGTAWLSTLLTYKVLALTHLALLPVLVELGKAWGIGIALSLVGVLYPALLAAKLQPIVVMREEP